MTFRKPDEISTVKWLFSGLNAKTLVIAIISVVSAHYIQGNRITVVEQKTPAMTQRMDELEKRLDIQLASIQKLRDQKLDLAIYENDQRRLADELHTIQESTGRIETILMQPKPTR